eukprot:TRINITY_DN925_c0_g1_i1.p1 TRINITY_DN925_c0_g1~~TRINITY_DN925_c0_g1_i1.p1  ORF type:complete len:490 (-),score=78.97 TRINITY_DN925_c0_g1_i1:48-1517(-)
MPRGSILWGTPATFQCSLDSHEREFKRADHFISRTNAMRTHLLIVACTLVYAANIQATNLLINGDFETAPCEAPICTIETGEDIGGWRVLMGSVDVATTEWQAASGFKSIDMTGSTAGKLQQTVALNVGQRYVLSYKLAGNPTCDREVKYLFVQAGPEESLQNIVPVRQDNMGWEDRNMTFTATNEATNITFHSLVPNSDCGAVIDKVELRPFPTEETSSGGDDDDDDEKDEILFNGDFELSECELAPCVKWTPDHISGWTVTEGSIKILQDDSGKSVDLNGVGRGTISQSPFLVPGDRYRLSFKLNANLNCDDVEKNLKVQVITGNDVLSWIFTTETAGWEKEKLSFIATTDINIPRVAAEITFASSSDGSCGPVVDNIKLRNITESESDDDDDDNGPVAIGVDGETTPRSKNIGRALGATFGGIGAGVILAGAVGLYIRKRQQVAAKRENNESHVIQMENTDGKPAGALKEPVQSPRQRKSPRAPTS